MANSPGWMENPASLIQILAPLMTGLSADGSTAGKARKKRPTSPRVKGKLAEHAVIADKKQQRDEQHQAEDHPGDLRRTVSGRHFEALAAGVGLLSEIEPPDHHQTDAVEQRDARQRIGSRTAR